MPNEHDYAFCMVIESIREFNRAVPFKPYEIRMASVLLQLKTPV
jgi:hypothetical protein